MSKKSINTIITLGNITIMLALILIFILQHSCILLEKNSVDSRLESKKMSMAILSVQKMFDDRTSMIRSYVFTGEEKYKDIFLNLSKIYSQEMPWPENYHSYLSHIDGNPNYTPKNSNINNLVHYFKKSDTNDYELSLLYEIKNISEKLHNFELDIVEVFNSGRVEDAVSMVNSNFYLSWKSELSRKITILDSIIKYRTELQSESTDCTQYILRYSTGLLVLLLIVFFIIYYRKTKNLVLSNITAIEGWSNKISKGDYNLELNAKILQEFTPITNSITSLSRNTCALVYKLNEIAKQDELTRMPNRRAAINFLKQKQKEVSRYYSRCSIIIIDIDYFKKINDTYGHPVGDQVLINVGQVITKYCRDSDYASRLGGEEFMVIAPQTDISSAYVLANKLKTKVESYIHQCGQHQIKVTISSGVSSLVAEGSVEQTYKQADDALYLAKKLGRNNVQIYSPPIDTDSLSESSINNPISINIK